MRSRLVFRAVAPALRPPGWNSAHDLIGKLEALRTFEVRAQTYAHYQSARGRKNGLKGHFAPALLTKVLLENLQRHQDGPSVTKDDILTVAQWLETRTSARDVAAAHGALSLRYSMQPT